MNIETQRFVASRFSDYYERKGSSAITVPGDLPEREFAFTCFGKEGMFRHIGFSKPQELLSNLRVNGPSHAYFSAAHYFEPGADTMGKKGWKGTDLIFDIDADHLNVPCKAQHDRWVCRECDKSGKGSRPEKCPECESTKVEDETWLCDECIEQAKRETAKLTEILSDDFGFTEANITVTYTGHRGYHTKVDSLSVQHLTPSERREIVDYITGRGINLQAHGITDQRFESKGLKTGPGKDDVGWGLKIYKSISKMIEKEEAPSPLLKDRIKVMDALSQGHWDQLRGMALKKWEKLATEALQRYGVAHIDEPVTTDIHRLIRLEGSLHGKTGFAVTRVHDLNSFDPFKEALAFRSDEAVTVKIEYANKFRVGDTVYGPFEKAKLDLPLDAAIFFMCKGVAEIAK